MGVQGKGAGCQDRGPRPGSPLLGDMKHRDTRTSDSGRACPASQSRGAFPRPGLPLFEGRSVQVWMEAGEEGPGVSSCQAPPQRVGGDAG